MASVAIGFGAALIALGVVGYLSTGGVSVTALIPAAFGLLLVVLGLLARQPERRKTAMHLAAAVSLLGFLGSASGLVKTARLMAGDTIARPPAAIAQAIMALLSLAFVALCFRSFINARRGRAPQVN